MPQSMTPGSAGPFGAISTKIANLTNKTTINDANFLLTSNLEYNYAIGVLCFTVCCCVGLKWPGPKWPFSTAIGCFGRVDVL
jgi:hypothetical protein